MKVLFTLPGWYLGGFTTFCSNLSRGLRKFGHSASLLVLPNARSAFGDVTPDVFNEWVVLRRDVSRLGEHIRKVAREISRLQPNVLVVNDSPYAMAALPYIPREILRLPVIHSLVPNEIELGLSNAAWWDQVIAVSAGIREALAVRGVGARTSVCSLGVPLPVATTRNPTSQNIVRLITVGRVVIQDKRMDRLPGIAQALRQRKVEYHWTVLGDGGYLPALRKELKDLSLDKCFSLEGSVSQPKVAAALQAADVLVMPSDSEGMPQALLEAMALGVVPVASRIPGSTTSVVEHGMHGYLCEPGDLAGFVGAIETLARNATVRSGMALRAAERIQRDFSLEAFAERFVAVLEAARLQSVNRAQPLPMDPFSRQMIPPRCLGFWQSLRHYTLGELKQSILRRQRRHLSPRGALPPSL